MLAGNSKILCKKTACHFAYPADIHTLFRETYKHAERSIGVLSETDEQKDYDWKPKFVITPLEVKNETNPFSFLYNPKIQE